MQPIGPSGNTTRARGSSPVASFAVVRHWLLKFAVMHNVASLEFIRAVLRRLGQWQRGRTHAAAMVPQIGGIGRPGKGLAWAGCGMN